MGPLSNAEVGGSSINNGRHSKCQQKERCVGPGCRIKTGKTLKKHRKHDAKYKEFLASGSGH